MKKIVSLAALLTAAFCTMSCSEKEEKIENPCLCGPSCGCTKDGQHKSCTCDPCGCTQK